MPKKKLFISDQHQLISIKEASRRVGCSYRTVKFWVDTGLLPSVPTPTGRRLISTIVLQELILRGTSSKKYQNFRFFNKIVFQIGAKLIDLATQQVIQALFCLFVKS